MVAALEALEGASETPVAIVAGVDLRTPSWAARRERLELVAQAFVVPLEALRLDDVDVTTAAHAVDRFDPPPNAQVMSWLPHRDVLGRASVTVCHGGMGITQKAVAAGVPVCVVPFGRDQFGVAGRVTASGAGTHLMPEELGPASLRTAIYAAIAMGPGAPPIGIGDVTGGRRPRGS